ncbi:MAG: TonB-dependent receptor [Bacteroidetes bacterium]|nr:TonB-dependent receptor [Bacteroidota bacterium]
MEKKYFLTFLLLFSFALVFGQKTGIKGIAKDATTKESLIGANIIYAPGKGVVTDIDGGFFIELPNGEYDLTISYVGYKTINKKVKVQGKIESLNLDMSTTTLTEVQVVSDMAKTRETPVAFTSVLPARLNEDLASRDIPMALNSTPGVYATQQGGGDGDARITIRGFNQRNVAVMIDGIPVNDMENGWVYWSNWFGLDQVTRNIQVQRGLGASKIAIPSIGGTMNIITSGIEAKKEINFKQDVTGDGLYRTSIGATTGKMKSGFAITAAGSFKTGDGYVDNTQSQGWFYYLKIDKSLGKHLISLSAMGAPQWHNQRSYKSGIATFSKSFAKENGVPDSIANLYSERGLNYNSNWGYIQRVENLADTVNTPKESLAECQNYFHKPQFSLRDFWNISDKVYMSNIVYMSIGNGGGTGSAVGTKTGVPSSSTATLDPMDGLVNFQTIYESNMFNPYNINPSVSTTDHWTGGILRSSINNHRWIGFLSTTNYKINPEFNFSGGIDLRDYKGQHYREIYDMLGGDYFMDNSDKTRAGSFTTDPKTMVRYKGDKIAYNNDGLVRWGGLFTQLEWKHGSISAFLNLSASYTGYQRIDYFKNKDIVIGDVVFEQAVGYGDILFYDGTNTMTFNSGNDGKDKMFTIGDTTFVVNINGPKKDTVSMVNPTQYNIDSKEARYATTDWKWILGYTIKGGLNYNINEHQNAFINLGYLSKAPRFNNVFDNNNHLTRDIANELVQAIELGYSINYPKVAINVNAYYTNWKNKPADFLTSITINEEKFNVNINGMDAIHKGIETDIAYKINKKIETQLSVSIGDWKWNSKDTVEIYDDNQNYIQSVSFDAKGVHVGDAAQTQVSASLRYQIYKGLYVKFSGTYYGRHYSNFDPLSLTGVNAGRESWKIPDYYIIDALAGYRFKISKLNMDFKLNLLNALDEVYISDATNNDSYIQYPSNDFDAKSASVFFGMGRRLSASLSVKF